MDASKASMVGGLFLPHITKSRDLLIISKIAAIVDDLRSTKSNKMG